VERLANAVAVVVVFNLVLIKEIPGKGEKVR
jgi:hypothetical protein